MKNVLKYSLLALTIFLVLTLRAQISKKYDVLALKYVPLPVETPGKEDERIIDWYIFSEAGKIYAIDDYDISLADSVSKQLGTASDSIPVFLSKRILHRPAKNPEICFKTIDGWLVGSNMGEWGGCLFWISSSGDSAVEILRNNIVGIQKINKQVICITGLSHLHSSVGEIYKIIKTNNLWTVDTVYNLGECPYASAVDDSQNLWVISETKLWKIIPGKKYTIVAQSEFWESYYPNSMIIKGKYIYIGMRDGILRYGIDSGVFTWAELGNE